jgi:hypothetical protein
VLWSGGVEAEDGRRSEIEILGEDLATVLEFPLAGGDLDEVVGYILRLHLPL